MQILLSKFPNLSNKFIFSISFYSSIPAPCPLLSSFPVWQLSHASSTQTHNDLHAWKNANTHHYTHTDTHTLCLALCFCPASRQQLIIYTKSVDSVWSWVASDRQRQIQCPEDKLDALACWCPLLMITPAQLIPQSKPSHLSLFNLLLLLI